MTSFLVGKSSSLVVTSAMSTCQTTDIVFVKWFDNKPILLASSIYGLKREDQCQRWSTKDRVHVTVNRPAIVSMYNKSMGAVRVHVAVSRPVIVSTHNKSMGAVDV